MTGKYGEIHGQCLIGPPCNPDGETKIALVIERSAQMTVWVGIAFVLDAHSTIGIDSYGVCWDYNLGRGTVSDDRGKTATPVGVPATPGI